MSKKPYKKYSLIERSAMTFESFLTRDFGSRFYSSEFLDGIAARKLEAVARMGKAGGSAFLFATMLAFFDLISGEEVSYGGLTIQITKDLTPIISFFTSAALLQTCLAFIDDQIIFRILLKMGKQIDIQSFPLLLVDKLAINLWGDAITPRYFGEKSGRGHHAVMGLMTVTAVLVMVAMYSYPAFMVFRVFLDLIWDDQARWIGKALAAFALALVIWATGLAAIFLVKFKFYPADWVESSGEPTKEFVQAMQEKIAKENDGTN